MIREEALQILASGSNHERLKAARYLMRNAQISDLPILRKARQAETVSYIKTSLDVAIARLSNLPTSTAPDPIDEVEIPEDVRRQIRSQAVEWIAGLLLHEIASRIGLVKSSASKEIPNYEDSKTKHYLESVQRTFEAIEQLKGAAAVPKPELFDLAEVINSIVAEEVPNWVDTVSLIGPRPLMIMSDPALVRLVICNGIRNAFEAVTTAKSTELYPIIINWDETNVDYWVSVLDRGVGIVGPVEAAFEIGKSTKQGHSGFGLAVARQAIETLGGTVRLEPATGGGTLYEARWER